MSVMYFSRAGRTAADALLVRSPQLKPLRARAVAQFGAGCLGAPSALEFARAGVGEVRILDHDFVDPATSARWPFGLQTAGLFKVDVLADFISRHYPATRPISFVHCLGCVRTPDAPHHEQDSDLDVIREIVDGASIIYDATAELGIQDYLSEVAAYRNIPYIAVTGTHGGWGGRVVSITPGVSQGCWRCYRCAREDGTIDEPPRDPEAEIQPQGCGDLTFTATGFDMTEIALSGVRTAIARLCRNEPNGYPDAPWDVLTIAFRDRSGALIPPTFKAESLERHSACTACNAT